MIRVVALLIIAGSLYLIWLGIGMLRHPPVIRRGENPTGDTLGRQVLKGFGVSGLNPQALSAGPGADPAVRRRGAVAAGRGPDAGGGSVPHAQCVLVYIMVGYGARVVLRTRPAARVVSYRSGIAMVLNGAFLLIDNVIGG